MQERSQNVYRGLFIRCQDFEHLEDYMIAVDDRGYITFIEHRDSASVERDVKR